MFDLFIRLLLVGALGGMMYANYEANSTIQVQTKIISIKNETISELNYNYFLMKQFAFGYLPAEILPEPQEYQKI